MRKFNIILIASALLFLPGILFSQTLSDNLLFTARLDGQQEVPLVNTAGQGLMTATLNPSHDTLCITASLAGLTGPATSAHIHVGLPGVIGPPVLDLTPFISITGNQIGATITGTDLTPQFIGELLSGRYYINIHTNQHPNGELRGQIELEADETYVARLDGQQETPPNVSTGRGLGIFHLSLDEQNIRFSVFLRDMIGTITNAHLHIGPPGTAGPPVVDMMPYLASLNGNYFVGIIDSSDLDTFLTHLRGGNIYFNVHSDTFPSGEIRGQLIRGKGINFSSVMDNEQEVPLPSTIFGRGVAYCTMNPGADTLRYEAVFGGLSSMPSSAHLHFGPVGIAGPVEVDLTDGLQLNYMTGTVIDTTVNHLLLSKMLSGNIYVNIHTPENPGGEIRGQLQPYARSGYTFTLDGNQLSPSVNTPGYGSGFVTVDPLLGIGRFEFLFDSLSSSVSGVSFNNGATGTTGPLIFDALPSVSGNSAMGYWLATDSNSLLPALQQTLLDEQAYLIIRTAQNPSGEVRGQILSGLACNEFEVDSTTVITTSLIDYNRKLNVYPNPSGIDDLVTARYVSGTSADATLTVFDMLGKKIIEQPVNASVGTNKFIIDLSNFGQGIYNVHLTIDGNIFTQPILRQ